MIGASGILFLPKYSNALNKNYNENIATFNLVSCVANLNTFYNLLE